MRYLLLGRVLAFLKWLNPYAKGLTTFVSGVFFQGFMINVPLSILFGFSFSPLLWLGLGLAYWIPSKIVKGFWVEWRDHKLLLEGRKVVVKEQDRKADAEYKVVRRY